MAPTHLTRAFGALVLLAGLGSAQSSFHDLGSAWPCDLSADGSVASGDPDSSSDFRWTAGGTFSFDFHARIDSGIDPNLVVGAQLWSQSWSRDQAAPGGSNLTDALHVCVVT